MPFVTINKGPGGHNNRAAHEPNIRMSCSLAEGKNKPKIVALYPSRALLEAAGIPLDDDKNTKCNLEVLEGTGDDAGFWLLRTGPKGYACAASKETSQTLTVAISFSKIKHYVLNECPVPAHDVEFTFDTNDHSILVQCPDWLRYNPLSVEEVKPIPNPTVVDMRPNRHDRRALDKHKRRAV